jgi:hypothetical protein
MLIVRNAEEVMEKNGTIRWARDSFQDHVQELDTRSAGIEGDETCLQTYLGDWLYGGCAVEYTGGNYETYLRVALDIADATMRGEIDYSYTGKNGYPRTVTSIHQEGATYSDIFSRTTYEVIEYQRRHSNG